MSMTKNYIKIQLKTLHPLLSLSVDQRKITLIERNYLYCA